MRCFVKSLLLTLLLAMAHANAQADESETKTPILGKWSRSPAECKRAELTFSENRAAVNIYADGTPTAFKYENIGYATEGRRASVKLGARHPYGKTPDKESLTFEIVNSNTIRMMLLKNKSTQFVRCPIK